MSRKRFTKQEREAVYQKCNGHCAYCGKEISIKEMQIDHKIPIHMEEAYKAIGVDLNSFENLLPACRSCNNYKDTFTVDLFRKMIEEQPKIFDRDRPTYRLAVRYRVITPTPHPVTFYFEKEPTPNSCQHCGHAPVVKALCNGYMVYCDNTLCPGTPSNIVRGNKVDAINEWNRRNKKHEPGRC